MSKLKAYTIAELVVALVITGIVISVSGTILRMVQRQFAEYEQRNRWIQEVNSFDILLRRDVEKAERITWENQELRITIRDQQIVYRFSTENVNRNGETFPVSSQDVRAQLLPDLGLVTQFSYTFTWKETPMERSFFKVYPPEALMSPLSDNDYLAR